MNSERAPRVAIVGALVFVTSDAITFLALLAGAMALRTAGRDWPAGGASITQLVFLSALLFGGSLAIAVARRTDQRRWLVLAAALGIAFVAGELVEWRALLAAHQGPAADLRHASLFVVTGLHALHVTVGAIALGWFARRPSASAARVLSFYWLALDLAWVGIVGALYLG